MERGVKQQNVWNWLADDGRAKGIKISLHFPDGKLIVYEMWQPSSKLRFYLQSRGDVFTEGETLQEKILLPLINLNSLEEYESYEEYDHF